LRKSAAANVTGIGLLSCVNSVVDLQVGSESKCFGTFLALVGFLSRVDENMALKIPRTGEDFTAVLTCIWFIAIIIDLFFVFWRL
jgi:hypothetical protein